MNGQAQKSQRQLPLFPPLLLVLAIADLGTELQLLFDHFTITSLIEAMRSHPLAIVVILAQPSLWRRYSPSRNPAIPKA